jgi:outer membrane protein OmpA-like peptidoglycan-associated protein
MMRIGRTLGLSGLLIFACLAASAAPRPDAEGCRDHPLLTRMKDFYIVGCREEVFGTHQFLTEEGKTSVEGRYTFIEYYIQDGAPQTSNLQILRNHTGALGKIGGVTRFEDQYSATIQLTSADKEIWIAVYPGGGARYELHIVEKETMEQEVVADAEALRAGIDRTGHVAVYGIYFDHDKAVVKPESEAALKEVAKLLQGSPGLNVHVVGHTDMVGPLAHNMQLSKARAAAVVEALVAQHGVARARLEPGGVGPLAPVAPNDTEEGKALNRRVELVKK